jgi:hypothetical protein
MVGLNRYSRRFSNRLLHQDVDLDDQAVHLPHIGQRIAAEEGKPGEPGKGGPGRGPMEERGNGGKPVKEGRWRGLMKGAGGSGR